MDFVSDLNFLTRGEIDAIIQGMTARDVFSAMPAGQTEVKGAEVAGDAFEAAAKRQGFGEGALDRVTPSDAIYLASTLGEVFNAGTPKDDASEASLDSPASGDSAPS